MAIGRPMPPVILDEVERERPGTVGSPSENGASFGAAGQNDLGCAEGRSNTTVGADLGVSDETVGKWRSSVPGTEAGRTVGRTAQRTASSGYR